MAELTKAQIRALSDLKQSAFSRSREGWMTATKRFVPLIVVAKLRSAGYAAISADKRVATITPKGQSVPTL